MAEAYKTKAGATPPARVSLPAGYRQGIITAITVMLGFSLLFLRYWDFELPGEWTPSSIAAAALMASAILIQIYTLWRSLQIEDDETRYGRTLRWFLSSTILLLVSLAIAGLSVSHIITF